MDYTRTGFLRCLLFVFLTTDQYQKGKSNKGRAGDGSKKELKVAWSLLQKIISILYSDLVWACLSDEKKIRQQMLK